MGKIILLKKHKNRNKKPDRATQSDEIPNNTENLAEFIEYMASKASEIVDSHDSELLGKREEDRRKEFEKRYKDVLSAAPISETDKIPYYANVMLDLLPAIFHSQTEEDRFDIYMDFSEFYLCEFDSAYYQYHKKNQQYEKEYLFRFVPMEADELKNTLQKCLQQIISLSPAKSSQEKSEIMWQVCRFFELYHILDNIFSEMGNKNRG